MSNWTIGRCFVSCSSMFVCHCNLNSKQNYCSHQVWCGQHKLWVLMCCQHCLVRSYVLCIALYIQALQFGILALHFGSLNHFQYRDIVEPMKGRQKVCLSHLEASSSKFFMRKPTLSLFVCWIPTSIHTSTQPCTFQEQYWGCCVAKVQISKCASTLPHSHTCHFWFNCVGV